MFWICRRHSKTKLANKEKAFDPFYTTMSGKGKTGPGMSIVFNPVTQTLKRTIHKDSSAKDGVAFTMIFPGI